jgi:hypothetical protein
MKIDCICGESIGTGNRAAYVEFQAKHCSARNLGHKISIDRNSFLRWKDTLRSEQPRESRTQSNDTQE